MSAPSAADALKIDRSGATVTLAGSATVDSLSLGGTANCILSQSEGLLSLNDFSVATGSRYVLSGGGLAVARQFGLMGQIDFASGSAAVTVAQSGTLDWSSGGILNAGNASVVGAVGSTVYLPIGFNPYTTFRSFTTQGYVFNTSGPLLIVPSGFVMKAVTDRTDKMRVEGVLQARDENGTSTNFTINKGGVEVAAGGSFVVDTSNDLYVQSNSGVTGGTLSIGGSMTIGTTNKPTVFTQSGGGVNTRNPYDTYYGNVTIQNASRYEQSGGSLQVGFVGGSADLTLTGGSRIRAQWRHGDDRGRVDRERCRRCLPAERRSEAGQSEDRCWQSGGLASCAVGACMMTLLA